MGDSGQGFRIAEFRIALLVDFVHGIQHVAALRRANSRWRIQIQDRLAVRAALHALVNAGKKAGSPELLAAVGCVATRDEHDEAGQILILGTKSIDNPRAKRRITEARIAGLNQQLRGGMVELIGSHRLDETKIVNMRSEEHTSELQSHSDLVCRLLLEKK